jgi:hypothetical protein
VDNASSEQPRSILDLATRLISCKAENACHIASALVRTGQKSEAEKYLQLARQLDPKCPLLTRAAKAIADGECIAARKLSNT